MPGGFAKHAFQLLYRAVGSAELKPSRFNLDEFDSIAKPKLERSAHIDRDRDLPLAIDDCSTHRWLSRVNGIRLRADGVRR